jgi:p21-activated kinase 1
MEEIKSTGRRLTKKPPPGSPAYAHHPAVHSVENKLDNLSLRSQRSSGSLQRAPSAPTYPRSANPGHAWITSPNPAYASSTSSLDYPVSAGPSPGHPSSDSNASSVQTAQKRFSNPTRALNEKTSEEFIGAPFDGPGILSHIDSTKASGYQNSLRRPPPPPLSHTSPDPRMMSPPLQQSQSFSSERSNEKAPPRIGDSQLISPKRYSDETKEPKNAVYPRKKSGFSGFMSGLVGSPRRVNISAPENPVHVTHVGYDNETGQFTVSFHLNLE